MFKRKQNLSEWFETEIQPHEDLLRNWLVGRFPDHCDIDDIIQETYVRVLNARRQNRIKAPKSFLFTTARNLGIDKMKSAHSTKTESLDQEFDTALYDNGLSIPDTVARNQELEILTHAIQSLPVKCRRIMTLWKVYDMSQVEIAEYLGISRKTVSTQITIGVAKCSSFLQHFNSQDRGVYE